MARLDIERQNKLEPERMHHAAQLLNSMGYSTVSLTDKSIQFDFKGEKVTLFPYSGWHTGKSIKDGRGIEKLLKQIKQK